MKRNLIKEKIYDILKEQLNLENNYFSRFSNDGENLLIKEELKCDLLDLYDILSKIEKYFNINLKDTEYFECIKLSDLINLVNYKINIF